ncbi:hypothetical protein MXB_1327 [Myxobolus squamalis]|nr:hypothetical protein MXB_1327 [Myxobolus squamalis]
MVELSRCMKFHLNRFLVLNQNLLLECHLFWPLRLYLLTISNGITCLHLNSSSCFYLLNPQENLDRTQKYFETIFLNVPSWNGIISRIPLEDECLNALQNHDLFVYCGHGNGKEYLKSDFIRKLDCSAVVILMGCHSAKFYKYDFADPMGNVFYYLLSGCPSVVANLWGVTDKDIDMFLDHFLYDILVNQLPLSTSLAQNRSKCNLRYLNGAAPVIYGIPVSFSKTLYPRPKSFN